MRLLDPCCAVSALGRRRPRRAWCGRTGGSSSGAASSRREAWRSPAATSATIRGSNGRWGRSPASTIASRRPCSGGAASRRPSRPSQITPDFPFNAYYPEARSGSSTGRPGHSNSPVASGQGAVDARPPAVAAAGGADHAARLRRRLERDRTLVGCSVPDLSGADRCRPDSTLRRFTCGERLLDQYRHGECPAPADVPRARLRGGAVAAEIRFPGQAAHSEKLGFKNPKHIMAITVTIRLSRRVLGGSGLKLVLGFVMRRHTSTEADPE